MTVITDTHALVWYFMDDQRLGKQAAELFDSKKDDVLIIVPTIVVLAELLYISRKGRITMSFENTLKMIEESANFDVASLDLGIIRIANTIVPDLEMHDSLIVSTAIHYGVGLITKDQEIIKSGLVNIYW